METGNRRRLPGFRGRGNSNQVSIYAERRRERMIRRKSSRLWVLQVGMEFTSECQKRRRGRWTARPIGFAPSATFPLRFSLSPTSIHNAAPHTIKIFETGRFAMSKHGRPGRPQKQLLPKPPDVDGGYDLGRKVGNLDEKIIRCLANERTPDAFLCNVSIVLPKPSVRN